MNKKQIEKELLRLFDEASEKMKSQKSQDDFWSGYYCAISEALDLFSDFCLEAAEHE